MKKSIYKMLTYMVLVVIVASFCAALEGLLSIFMMKAVDAVIAGDRALFNHEVIRLLLTALALIPVTIVLAYARGLYKRKSIVSAKYNYITGVFKKNINEFQRDNNSKYVSALTNDVNTIENNFIDGLYEVIVNIAYFIVAILVIGYISPVALALGISIGIVSTLISIVFSKPLQKHHKQRSTLYEDYTSYIKEVISAFHIIKSNNLSDKVQNDFYSKSYDIQHKGYIIDKIYTFINAFQQLNMSLTMYVMLGIIAYMSIKGSLTLGGVILVIQNLEKIMMPINQLGEWMPKIFATKSLFEKIDDTLKNQDNYQEDITLDRFNSSIEFKGVSFSYEDSDVLNDVSLSLRKGEKYLVVGPSGGGKSTLLKLLRKYYVPKSGKILLDKNDLKDITKESYFHHIANIEQQVFLFEDTVRNNITLYKDYSIEEIDLAIDRAGLRDFIEDLPQGLDSILYDNGKNVSGGEKSRIAIARGLLQKADIIFLDEAFASLDSKIAKEIENTILNLKNITVINVSHVIFEETKKRYSNVFMVKNKGVYSI